MILDPRIHAYDEVGRLAESPLLGRLDNSFTFIDPRPAWNGDARLSLRARPDALSPQVTEALPGEALEVIVRREGGWAWLRTLADGYLGFGRSEGLRPQAPAEAVTVTALRGHIYAEPSIKASILAEVCLGAQITRASGDIVEEHRRRWLPVMLAGGAGWLPEVLTLPPPDVDAADLALHFLGTPYVWGGRSAWGLDCSGLVQVVYAAFGRGLPRDADMQQEALDSVDTARRGDLAFFDGHVGLMLDQRRMVHANATHMAVSVETLGEGEYGQRLQEELLGFGRWPG